MKKMAIINSTAPVTDQLRAAWRRSFTNTALGSMLRSHAKRTGVGFTASLIARFLQ